MKGKSVFDRKHSSAACLAWVLFLFAMMNAPRVCAQTNLALGLSVPTNAIQTGGSLTYTMFVTNMTATTLPGGVVSNSLSAFATVTGVSTTQGSIATNGNVVVFNTGPIPVGVLPQLTLTVSSTSAGFITNTITLVDLSFATVVSITNVVNPVTNATTTSDLGVAIFGPSSAVYSNDWVNYSIGVTNFGSAVTNVLLTNSLPASVGFIRIVPADSFTGTSSNMVFNLGTLASGGSTNFVVTVQPTNSGTQTISVSVGAPGLVDSNTTNNFASTNITVLDFAPAQLVATNLTTMAFNPQNSRMTNTVRVWNFGSGAVASARLIITGATNGTFGTSNWLANAVGTNNGNPFVIYGNTLNPGSSVDLLLEYFIRNRTPIGITDSNYVAVAINAADFSASNGTNGTFAITNIVILPDQSVLIEFESLTNKSYTVIYSDSLGSTQYEAQPDIISPGNRVQWIDSGPPKTISPPSAAPSRMYRVRQNN
jgi:uncharacterized repeat protein (TIGR01451 family)